jgi:imidazolonepropionase-like amidohydrolase
MARLRAFIEDARIFRARRADFRENDLYRLSAGRLDLEAAEPALLRRTPVVIEAHRASDIRAAVRLAEEARLDLVLLGASEGWRVAELLAQEAVPVIVDPMANLPFRFESRNARSDNPALLARAGVKVILTSRSSHNAGNLRYAVGNAVRAGFPATLALRSATLSVAEAFGQEDEVGSLQAGRRANVVVWTGDPFETRTHAARVFVRGREQPTVSRQTRLARRYIERLGLAPTSAP